MAQLMNDEQRLTILEAYNPKEHLISVGTNKDRTPVLYYPAAWRLYELRLRHPHFTLEAEIIHMDEEKGTVIIKAIGYDGLDYASSNLKGTALKQGKLFELDKVETKAKSRVARDVGIGTEYALDMDADETDARHDVASQNGAKIAQSNGNGNHAATAQAQAQNTNVSALIGSMKNRAKALGLCNDAATFKALLQEATGEVLDEKDLTLDRIAKVNGHMAKIERMRKAS